MSTIATVLPVAIRIAGLGLLVLVLASPAIPRVLRWRERTAQLQPLTRQVFWTYATYTWFTNIWFTLIALLLAHQLVEKTALAAAVTAFIAAYWIGRIAVQFLYFDRSDMPTVPFATVAETALIALFIYLALTFSFATLVNLGVI